MTQLEKVHARILLIEALRGTAPDVETWSETLLEDAYLLADELVIRIVQEDARRRREGF
jgi:hypothetical protein